MTIWRLLVLSVTTYLFSLPVLREGKEKGHRARRPDCLGRGGIEGGGDGSSPPITLHQVSRAARLASATLWDPAARPITARKAKAPSQGAAAVRAANKLITVSSRDVLQI